MNQPKAVLLALSLFVLAAPRWAPAQGSDEAAIAAKAAELLRGIPSKARQVLALHRFVRDEIRETPAQFG